MIFKKKINKLKLFLFKKKDKENKLNKLKLF